MSSSRFQRRHYEQAVRDIIAAPTAKQEKMITKAIALFAADNPRFRADFFRAALTGQRRDKSRPKHAFKPAKLDRFGLVKHGSRKIASLYWKNYHTGHGSQPKKMIHVRVQVERATVPTNTGRKSGYFAVACVGKVGGMKGRGRVPMSAHRKCGTDEFGKTPTAAVKKALVALGRDSHVK